MTRQCFRRRQGGRVDEMNLFPGEAACDDLLYIGTTIGLRAAAASEINLQNGFGHFRSKGPVYDQGAILEKKRFGFTDDRCFGCTEELAVHRNQGNQASMPFGHPRIKSRQG